MGRIVELDPEEETYHLPQEHAAWLTRAASPNNVAFTTQFIPLMGSVEDGIVDKFRNGGGLPYAAFPHFHEVMAEDSAQTTVAALKDHILYNPGRHLRRVRQECHLIAKHRLHRSGHGQGRATSRR